MSQFARSPVTAILGPTNTGKTHLAVERMCGHSSGMIGFPLRLLAREVYDRVVGIKGKDQVALITGEEKILPPKARWFLCTAESMPVLSGRPGRQAEGPLDRDVAFVALDEAQIGADPGRGHVFTDRLLRARGREETMILGSESLKPLIRNLVPDAEIITRPRFSTLSYAGAKKLSKLPPRSAIVAFSAEEVYAVAEMLRRLKGGAAVVMGALSPRTRNAQVDMFQAGEVDYLVATDAIGMGLNMDVAHVAFAGLAKFDGRRRRRLSLAEMAQIAGRAGRHQKDGTFGTLGAEDGGIRFTPEEIERIEEHRFPPLDHLFWRDGLPDLSSLDALIGALEARPTQPMLRAAPEAIDLAVLKRLAGEPWVRERTTDPAMVRRLWAASGLPDFRKSGADHHSRLAGRVFRHLSEGTGHVPVPWFADEIARLDSVQGDVETLAGRLAATRTWAYIAHRPDWMADPAHWAERTRALEEKLSDALHAKLTQRFVDRRTAVLMREIGSDPDSIPVTIAEDGEVRVDDEPIGRLDGFRFTVAADARLADRRKLLAVAERRLGRELSRRAAALAAAPDEDFTLDTAASGPLSIAWAGFRVAHLAPGKTLLAPRVKPDRALDALDEPVRRTAIERLDRWLAAMLARHLKPLQRIADAARDAAMTPPLRALLAPLAESGGLSPRAPLDQALAALDRDGRHQARRLGLVIGALDLFNPQLLKPEAIRWRAALRAVRQGTAMPPMPAPGVVTLAHPSALPEFRTLGAQSLRIDLAERIARAAHDGRDGRKLFLPDPSLATSLGLSTDSLARLMRLLGFETHEAGWRYRGRTRPREIRAVHPGNAFAELGVLVANGG
ncbi:helicase-related protein [Sphingobium boeckii]|uniref:ATP-dependent RNA helicase SUPV3L1/SUV3 n=1 Tax=Sphingobium boeckii TaxID=1082345 RepID=A0A7W9EDN4_9SPHN|nr:helicase-related protein [Sphingobium boeckii]MBB5684155.1 ATP-dependent RNA helicase SUPV3L1/SUV3 [Sphingobium boeckii]